MDAQLQTDLKHVKVFFEQCFGCVVGCGCWEPNWDEDLKVITDAWNPQAMSGLTLADMRRAFERSFANLGDADIAEAAQLLELVIEEPADFRGFFQKAHDHLARVA